jgi:hypothetical protein
MVQECGTTMFTIYSAALPNVIKLRDDIIFSRKETKEQSRKGSNLRLYFLCALA